MCLIVLLQNTPLIAKKPPRAGGAVSKLKLLKPIENIPSLNHPVVSQLTLIRNHTGKD